MTRPTMRIPLRMWLMVAAATAAAAVVLVVAVYFAAPGIMELPGIKRPPRETTMTPPTLPTRVESLTPPGGWQDSSTVSAEDSVSPGLPATARIPDVRGKPYEEAAELMRMAGFLPTEKSVQGRVDSDAGEPGKVYRMTPAQGTWAQRGSTVELRTWRETQ